MIKFASVALTAALGAAALAQSLPAAADPAVVVEVPARSGAIVAPAGFIPAHYRAYDGHDRYWHHRHERFDRFHHRRHWYWY
jgi:hypothetical protein